LIFGGALCLFGGFAALAVYSFTMHHCVDELHNPRNECIREAALGTLPYALIPLLGVVLLAAALQGWRKRKLVKS
jgi:hypothetical protein